MKSFYEIQKEQEREERAALVVFTGIFGGLAVALAIAVIFM